MASGIYAEADAVARAVFVRQCGSMSATGDRTLARACREAHRIAVAKLVARSDVFGGYLDMLNSDDENDETALAILSRVGKLDTSRGGVAVVNCMVTMAMNGIRNRIRYMNAKKRKADTVSYEEISQSTERSTEHVGKLEIARGEHQGGSGTDAIIDGAIFGIGAARSGRDWVRSRVAGTVRAAALAARAGREAGRRFDTGNWVQTELELVFA